MKFTLLVLAFMAPLSVAYFLSALTTPGSKPLDASILNQVPTISAYEDMDGDGLSNRDENLWRTDWQNPDTDSDGFLDGEEVLSGHDPRKPGPNDFLDRSKNLTERFGSLFVGGALTGSIDPLNPNTFPIVGDIADEIFDEYERFAMISQEDIDLNVVDDTLENLVLYIAAIAPHLDETFPDALRYAEDFLADFRASTPERAEALLSDEKQMLTMRTQAERIQIEMDELSQVLIDMPVPQSMARPHKNGIILLQSIAIDIETSTFLEADPLRVTLANTSLISLLTRTAPGFTYDFASTLKLTLGQIIPEEGTEQ